MNMIDLSELYEAPIDPAALDFTTKQRRACRSCIFERQRISVCDKAVAMATKAGMGSCDDEHIIYKLKEKDERQISIIP